MFRRSLTYFAVLFALGFSTLPLSAATVEKTFMTNEVARKQIDLSMYKLVFSRANLPKNGDGNVGTTSWYDYANTTDFASGWSSAAFYLQTTNASTGKVEWVLAEAPNYSGTSLTQLGIPRQSNSADTVNLVVTGSNVYTSYSSANMPLFKNVTADADGVKSITEANLVLEFWGFNYSGDAQSSKKDQNGNDFSFSGATTSGFDWNDTPGTTGNHGSYQIHLYDSTTKTGQTLFGISRLYRTASTDTMDVGIGNSPQSDKLDWTMATNTAAWENRSLQILAIPNYAAGSFIFNASSGKPWEDAGAWFDATGTAATTTPTADSPVHVNAGTIQVSGTANAKSLALEQIAGVNVTSTGSLTVASGVTTDGTIASAGAVKISGNLIVGSKFTTGSLTLTGGTFTASNIYLGNTNGASATATISGDSTSVSGLSDFRVSNVDGASASLTVKGGSISSSCFNVGFRGTGTLTMEGGKIQTTSYFCIGNNAASANGIVNHSGGTIQSPWVPLGHNGKGTYNLSGTGLLKITSNGTMDAPGSTNNGLEIGDRVGSNVTFTMTGGSIESAGWVYVGRVGTGVLNQSAGSVTAAKGLSIGHLNYYTESTTQDTEAKTKTVTRVATKDQWGVGTYNLSGTGTLNLTSGTLYVGRYGMGTFTQKGGTLTLPGNMVLGEQVIASQKLITTGVGTTSAKTTTYNYNFLDRATGTYELSEGGKLDVSKGTLYVGNGGKGVLKQSGGSEITAKTILVAQQSIQIFKEGSTTETQSWQHAKGEYTISDAATKLTVTDYMNVGGAGDGTFTVNDGTVTVTNALKVGSGGWSQSSMTQKGGTITAGSFAVASANNSSVTFTMSGGKLESKGSIVVADQNASKGTLNLSNGTITAAGDFNFGNQSGSTGTLTMTGGTIKASNLKIGNAGTGTATVTNGTINLSGRLTVGESSSSVSSLTINKGTTITAGTIAIGNSGSATVTFNDGKITSSGWFLLGFNNQGVTNTMTQNGGTLDVGWFTMQWDQTGGSSVYNMNGGELISRGTSNGFVLSKNGDCTFNLNGGTVTAAQASTSNINWSGYALSVGTGVSSGKGTLNISGGTFNANGKTYIQKNSSVNFLTSTDAETNALGYGVLNVKGDLQQLGAITLTHIGAAPDWVEPVTILTVTGSGVPEITNNSPDVYQFFWDETAKKLVLQTSAGTANFSTGNVVELPEGTELTTGWFDLVYRSGTRSFDLQITTEATDSFMAALEAQLAEQYGTGASATKKDDGTVEITMDFNELPDVTRYEWNFTAPAFNGAAVTGIVTNYVPEPTTWLLLMLGVGIGVCKRRSLFNRITG